MKSFLAIALLALVGSTNAATLVTNEEVRAYIQKNGHDPSLSPEQLYKKTRESLEHPNVRKGDKKKLKARTIRDAGYKAAPAAGESTMAGRPDVSHEELLQHINEHGHNPSLSPEQIYKRFRAQNGV